MISTYSQEEKKKGQKVLGLLENTRLSQDVVDTLSGAGTVKYFNPAGLETAGKGLDALVLAYEDAEHLPRMFSTPTVLVGTEHQYHLLPPFSISAFIPIQKRSRPAAAGGLEEYACIDKTTLDEKILPLADKVRYVRAVERSFGNEFAVSESTLQDIIQEEKDVSSLFDAYFRYCQEFIKDRIDDVKSLQDQEKADAIWNKLAEFACATKDPGSLVQYVQEDELGYGLLTRLRRETKMTGLVEGLNEKLLGSQAGQDLIHENPQLFARIFALFVKEITVAPVGYERYEQAHSIRHIPSVPLYFKIGKGKHYDSYLHEARVLRHFKKYLNWIRNKLGERFISIPEVVFAMPRSVSEKIEFGFLAVTELPGIPLSTYLHPLQVKTRTHPRNSPEWALASGELDRIRDAALDQNARITALAYAISKLENEQGLLRQSHTNKPEELLERLKNRFFGDPQSDEDFRGLPGGVRKAGQESTFAPQIAVYEETIVKHITPVLEVIAAAAPGIDTDRSAQNALIEYKENSLYVHNLDFETFRNDPIIQNWVHTAVWLDNYDNGRLIDVPDDLAYGGNERPVLRKGEKVTWPRYSLFTFLKKVHNYFADIRGLISSRKPSVKYLRLTLPGPEQAEREFYALSAYRGSFFFGFLERFRDLRKTEIALLDHYQDLFLENARYSIQELGRISSKSIGETLTTLYDSYGRLHDVISVRGKTHDH